MNAGFRRWRRVVERSYDQVLRSSAVVVSPIVREASRRRADGTGVAAPGVIRPGVIAATAHWSAPGRTEHVARLIEGIADQGEPFSIAVYTNGPRTVREVQPSLQALVDERCDDVTVEVVEQPELVDAVLPLGRRVLLADWRGGGHPYRLTWQHKELFRALAARDDLFEHIGLLVYLEDDMQFAPGGFAYWRRYRDDLAARGLFPGFLRLEGPLEDRRVAGWPRSVGSPAPFPLPAPPGVAPDDALWFAAMSNPYQAMYVLDEGLAGAHFRSSLFRERNLSKYTSAVGRKWGVPERAASGPLFDEPLPPGYAARAVVPLIRYADGTAMPYEAATTDHVSRNYYIDASTPMSKQPLDGAFRFEAD